MIQNKAYFTLHLKKSGKIGQCSLQNIGSI